MSSSSKTTFSPPSSSRSHVLNSGKVAKIKRPKPQIIIKAEDMISKLPDAMLIQILSLLPDADAYRTRILSNRWKDTWQFLPNLHFAMSDEQQVGKFHDIVDKTLALRGGMPIQSFFLSCTNNYVYDRVYNWIRIVVQCKVQQLELRFPTHRHMFKFCWDLYKSCDTLVVLTLEGVSELNVPEITDDLFLPCLKKITLLSISYTGGQSPANLISGCPVLEDLCLERQVFSNNLPLTSFRVYSTSLKRLRIKWCVFDNCEVVICAPKLEYIYVQDNLSTKYSLATPLSVVEAHISSYSVSVVQLVSLISSAEILTLTAESSEGLSHFHGLNLPIFPNLVKLVIAYGGHLLPVLLNNMPNLEHITISDGLLPSKMEWDPPVEEPPACLRFKIKEIIILNYEALTSKDVTLIRYLLKQSHILEKLTIKTNKVDLKKRKQILNIHPRSKSCRVEFV